MWYGGGRNAHLWMDTSCCVVGLFVCLFVVCVFGEDAFYIKLVSWEVARYGIRYDKRIISFTQGGYLFCVFCVQSHLSVEIGNGGWSFTTAVTYRPARLRGDFSFVNPLIVIAVR